MSNVRSQASGTMNRISSGKTFFFKNVLPFVLFAWPIVVIGFDGTHEENAQELALPVLIAAAACGLVFWYMRRFADEVLDQGDHLVVSRGGQQDRISLSQIMNINSNPGVASMAVITLRLAEPGKFGSAIAFIPIARFGLSFGGKNVVAEKLVERAYRSRSPHEI